MIVRMQKITLLVSAQYQETALNKLREVGALHVIYIRKPSSEDIESLETEMENVENALRIIGLDISQEPPEEVRSELAADSMKHILCLAQQKDALAKALRQLKEKHHWFETWGPVSYASLQDLKKACVHVRFYQAARSALRKLPEDRLFYIAREEGSTVYFAFFAKSPEERLEFKEEIFPAEEPGHLEAEISRVEEEVSRIESKLEDLSKVRKGLLAYQSNLRKRLEFDKVRDSMWKEAHVAYLQGYCPLESIQQIKTLANREGWAYTIEDPDDPKEVPTLIRNPRWLRIIEPLWKFIGTLPGYDEQDVSLVFLFFFSLFYAMLVGDAGYGVIFLLATFYFARKKKGAPREAFRLLYLLSGATIVWGLLTGTWFGSEKIAQIPFLKSFVIDRLDSFADSNRTFMMQLTFIIAVVHLSIGRLFAAFQKINSPKAMAELGWVAILCGMYFIACSLILGKQLPGFVWILFVVGSALIAVFAHFQKNILKGMLLTISNLPLNVINTFSDVVSYIRLFAVGLATVIVASSFNEMALAAGVNSVLSGLFTALILLFGHSLNILLAMMSVLVHGVRLNMLEFSTHVGMQWTGTPYQPFKE